jgi:hypothetical protein
VRTTIAPARWRVRAATGQLDLLVGRRRTHYVATELVDQEKVPVPTIRRAGPLAVTVDRCLAPLFGAKIPLPEGDG